MSSLGRYWRTLRHLKARQFVGRVTFKLGRPRMDSSPAPARRPLPGPWAGPARREPSMTGPEHFRFIGIEGDLSEGWDAAAQPKLWRYNLHYFDDLNAFEASHRAAWHRALIQRWIAGNPGPHGSAWEPYPVSLRLVNWIKWAMSGNAMEPAWIHSAAVQARWLRRRLEVHLLGNHLFANAKALVHAGVFFSGPEADEWLACGTRILAREVPEQVLADGGHFERSPMYHALALEDVLDLINVLRAPGAGELPPHGAQLLASLEERVQPMRRWLDMLSHPDGGLGLFNDAADGIAPPAPDLHRLATDLGFPPLPVPPFPALVHLDPSGYVRIDRGPMSALLDVAAIGPDYLPGHAHADTLSFELSLGPRRVIVNGGTSQYGDGAERQRERSTAAHSTVEVAGENSSEVWAGFRVGRRARPIGLAVRAEGPGPWEISCGHTGYQHLPGRPEHRRTWQFTDSTLLVEDRVSAAGLAAVARFILAPGVTVRASSGQHELWADGRCVGRLEVVHGQMTLEDGHHAARFGERQPATVISVHLQRGQATTRWTWNNHAHPLSH